LISLTRGLENFSPAERPIPDSNTPGARQGPFPAFAVEAELPGSY
jgi:hypothetical protein